MCFNVQAFDDTPLFQQVNAVLNPQNVGIQERIFPINSAVNVGAGEQTALPINKAADRRGQAALFKDKTPDCPDAALFRIAR